MLVDKNVNIIKVTLLRTPKRKTAKMIIKYLVSLKMNYNGDECGWTFESEKRKSCDCE